MTLPGALLLRPVLEFCFTFREGHPVVLSISTPSWTWVKANVLMRATTTLSRSVDVMLFSPVLWAFGILYDLRYCLKIYGPYHSFLFHDLVYRNQYYIRRQLKCSELWARTCVSEIIESKILYLTRELLKRTMDSWSLIVTNNFLLPSLLTSQSGKHYLNFMTVTKLHNLLYELFSVGLGSKYQTNNLRNKLCIFIHPRFSYPNFSIVFYFLLPGSFQQFRVISRLSW